MEQPRAILKIVESGIKTAFLGVRLGSGVSIRQSQFLDSWRGDNWSQIAAEFEALMHSEITNDWSQIPDSELEKAQVGQFDAEAFRYYIPALALRVLRCYDGLSMRVTMTISSLYAKKGDLWNYHMDHYSLLDQSQKRALAIYLQHLPELVPFGYGEQKLVERALRNY